jgi:hypothetical protein
MDDDIAALIAKIDAHRRQCGFMSVGQLLNMAGSNTILDPFSTLISAGVAIGQNNIIYPNVIIECRNAGTITLGSSNVFYPGTLLLADQGKISVGSGNEFGDGGVRIKANMPDALISIGDDGRYMNGAEIMGKCNLGSGTQILGAITVQNCDLGAGGSYRNSNPDLRGGLLKGFGLARNLEVNQGEVINGKGSFDQTNIERQAGYHPPKV